MLMYLFGTLGCLAAFAIAVSAYVEYKNNITKVIACSVVGLFLLLQYGVFQPYKEITEEKYIISFAENRAFITVDGCLINLNTRLNVNLEPGTITIKRHKGFWAGILWKETHYQFFQNGKYLGGKYYTEIAG